MKKSKKKLVIKGISLVLSGTMATAFLTGCEKKKALLEDTILEEAVVMYVDDNPLIVRPVDYSDTRKNCMGYNYEDILTGTIYHNNLHAFENGLSEYESSDKCVPSAERDGVIIVDNAQIKSLTQYLTEEEIKKASEGNFTDADAIAVQQRLTKQVK